MRRATAPRRRTPSTSTHPAWRPRPIRHVTGAPVTTCEKLHRHLRQCRAFLTAEPVSRLEATLRIGHGSVSRGRRRDGRYGQKWADSNGGSRRGEAAVKSAAGSHPLLGQQGSPLPWCEDDAPVFRPSNGSCNDRPVSHPSRRINFAAGQAAPLAGKAGVVSSPP
jgi:hypothetical protein